MLRVSVTRFISQRSGITHCRTFASTASGKSSTSKSQEINIASVKGFSDRVVKVPKEPVGFAGSTKTTEYKNPEYFCYHVDSFGDSMLELEKYRLPAPSNKKKFKAQ